MIDVSGDICLASSSEWKFAALSAPRQVGKVTHQRFRKELIMVGDFVKESDDLKFSVTPATLRHWAATFGNMKANGVKVPIPSTHEGVDDPDKNRGWVEDIFVDGDSLVMLCDLIGDDAIAAAARNDVSIGCPSSFTDGRGTKYERPIHHVALTPNPVIPGLSAFEPIAASHKSRSNDMDLTAMAKRLGITASLTDANAIEEIGKAFDAKGNVALSNVAQALGATSGLDGIDKIELAVKTVVDKQVAAAIKAAQPEEKKVDPMLLKLSRTNCEHTLGALVSAARITPATSDSLKELYLSDTALTLSLSSGACTDQFDKLCAILKGNDPVKLGGVTGQQALKLANPMSAEDNPVMANAEKRAKAAV